MIKTSHLVPEIYSRESRDFQFFAHVYDIVFNYVKTNTDLMLTDRTKETLDLLVRTLGFEPKGNYDDDEIYSVISSWSTIIRNKGSMQGVESAIRAVLRPKNKSKFVVQKDKDDGNIVIYLDENFFGPEISLLDEILYYIMPVNSNYVIKQSSQLLVNPQKIITKDSVSQHGIKNDDIAKVSSTDTDESVNPGDVRYGVLASGYEGTSEVNVDGKTER